MQQLDTPDGFLGDFDQHASSLADGRLSLAAMEPPDDTPLSFTCPRCGTSASALFYGPCPGCRADLVASQAGQARNLEAVRFEPALHVIPNQVATKE